jgi:hypothetical protein
MAASKRTRKVVKKNIFSGIAHIQSTFNNTLITITDVKRQCRFLGECWFSWLQGFSQEHSLRGSASCGGSRP